MRGQHYLVATDSYVLAAVPIEDPGDDTDEGLIPTSLLVRARRALVDARKRYKRYSNVAEDDVELTAKGDTVRLAIKNADFGGAWGDVDIESKRTSGTFPSVEQLIDQNGPHTSSKVAYGTIRVTFNAHYLVRLAKALGAVQGRGKNAYSVMTLDLPVNEDGSVNQLRAIRVQPGAIDNGAIGLLMPVRSTVDLERALDAWPKPKPSRKPKAAAKKAASRKKAGVA